MLCAQAATEGETTGRSLCTAHRFFNTQRSTPLFAVVKVSDLGVKDMGKWRCQRGGHSYGLEPRMKPHVSLILNAELESCFVQGFLSEAESLDIIICDFTCKYC